MSVKLSILNNGLRVITDSMPEAESVVVGTWVGVGTRHEPWRANGVAHLVEHMMFKGTRKRSAYGLSAAIEKNGGMMNAHTTQEETAYYARVLPEDTSLAIDVIADMLQHSLFAPKELDRERQVIIQEIGRYLDSPEDHIFDLMQSRAFPKQKIGRSILGSANVIARLPRSEILSYIHRHYHTNHMVLVAAGKVDHDSFVKLAKKHLGRLCKRPVAKIEKAHVVGGSGYFEKDIEQLHIIFGFPAPASHSPLIYATQLLSLLLGGSSSSRLFQKIREKRGLVYTINSHHIAFRDAGLFQIYAGTDPARVRELVPVICRELQDVTRSISAGELNRAKAQIRADLLMGQESVMRRAELLGHQMVTFGRVFSVDEILHKILNVSRDDVQAVAGRLFEKNPIVTALGPLDKLEPYERIVERLAS